MAPAALKKLPETNKLLFNYKIFCAFDIKIFLQLFLYFAKLVKISRRRQLPKKCIICGKSARSGSNISHSHHKTKRKFRPNLQKINIILNGRKKKAYVCTQCITAGKVTKSAWSHYQFKKVDSKNRDNYRQETRYQWDNISWGQNLKYTSL